MITIFGPAGAGKTVQGQLLAERMGWRWLSAGQLLRDSHDPELAAMMQRGEIVPVERTNRLISEAIAATPDEQRVILDGFPRVRDQAEWLVASQPEHGRSVQVALVLDVPREEVLARLAARGRADDEPEAIDKRLAIYEEETRPVIDFFAQQGIAVVHIDGVGSIDEVQDRIVSALKEKGL